MGKKSQRQSQGQRPYSSKLRRNRLIAIAAVGAISVALVLAWYNSSIPANGTTPVVALPSNHFLKATHSDKSGYIYQSQSSGSVKGLRNSGGGGGIVNPSYVFAKGNLQSIHVINEDYDTHSKHNFNIDEFNVHTKDLGYFESQTVTFLPGKAGAFDYYCTINSEMKGVITVE